MTRARLVCHPALLVEATAFASATWTSWPRVPPVTSHPAADCLGIVASAGEHDDWSLFVSDRLLALAAVALHRDVGLTGTDVRDYLTAVERLAVLSGGGMVPTPPRALGPGTPEATQATLSLAEGLAGAPTAVAALDADVLRHGPSWSAPSGSEVPVLHADDFRARVDAARRSGLMPPRGSR